MVKELFDALFDFWVEYDHANNLARLWVDVRLNGIVVAFGRP